eukprot:UN33773
MFINISKIQWRRSYILYRSCLSINIDIINHVALSWTVENMGRSFLQHLDRAGFVEEQVQLYETIGKMRRIVEWTFVCLSVLAVNNAMVIYFFLNDSNMTNNDEYDDASRFYIAAFEFTRGLAYNTAAFVWLVFLLHVYIYKGIGKIFMSELENSLGKKLTLEKRATELVANSVGSLNAFTNIFFWLLIFICVGIILMQSGIAYSSRTMKFLGVQTWIFLMILSCILLIVGSILSIRRKTIIPLKNNIKYVCTGTLIFVGVVLLFTDQGQTLIRSTIIGVTLLLIWMYYLVEYGYDAVDNTAKLVVELRNQKVESLISILDT